jgi:hypothetical protein
MEVIRVANNYKRFHAAAGKLHAQGFNPSGAIPIVLQPRLRISTVRPCAPGAWNSESTGITDQSYLFRGNSVPWILVQAIEVAREIPAALLGAGAANCGELFFGYWAGQLFHDRHRLFFGCFFSLFHFVLLSLVLA